MSMQRLFEGHTETRTDVPELLSRDDVWSRLALGLPASLLSAASIGALAIALAVLRANATLRALFVLPLGATFALAAVTACGAWLIVRRCRERPGRSWPRYWALALFVVATLVGVSAIFAPSPLVHAGLVATTAGVVALSPRALRLRADSPWLQRVAPLSLAASLALVPTSAAWLGSTVAAHERRETEEFITRLRHWTEQIRSINDADWSLIGSSPELASRRIETLRGLKFTGLDDRRRWEVAATLGRDQELADAARGLVDVVAEGLITGRGPRLSRLENPAVWLDPGPPERWAADPEFARASQIAGEYHARMAQRFIELEIRGTTHPTPKMSESAAHYVEKRREVSAALGAALVEWTDHWSVLRVPAPLTPVDVVPLVELLRKPLATSTTPLSAGALERLLSLDAGRAREAFAGAPGCRPLDYDYRGQHWFRVDCYAYQPTPQGFGATPRAEVRLVYGGPRHRTGGRARPVEVFFLFFFIPDTAHQCQPGPHADTCDLAREVMIALDAAARRAWPKSRRLPGPKGASVASGNFVLTDGSTRVRVTRPVVRNIVPGLRAVEVRAVPE